MALADTLPRHLFTRRGWGMLAAAIVAFAAAQVMGRRDLLTLAVLLAVLPLVSLAGIRLVKPRFRVYREFSPPAVETSAPATVRLAVARTGTGSGRAIMEERLPSRFGESPAFRFPSRSAAGGTSRYEYHLRCSQRGQFVIGPVTAEFTDPFGLSLHRRAIDDGDTLTVTPSAVVLPLTSLAGARGNDGVTATRIRANPSDDDVMTREYRHGDPMRRVHWAATARHGELMVRQEESVTTPEATIILDQRWAAFAGTAAAAPPGLSSHDGHHLVSSQAFEWAVVAAMSISAHLIERNYGLRLLDTRGEPAFLRSPSAPEPGIEEYAGTAGLQAVAESLAAIELSGAHPRGEGVLQDLTRGLPVLPAPKPRQDQGPSSFDDKLLDKLSAHRMRGPLIAVLGRMSVGDAQSLGPAAGYAADAFAMIVAERPAESAEVLEVLQQGGWRAAAVAPSAPIASAWSRFDEDADVPRTTATEASRGAGARP